MIYMANVLPNRLERAGRTPHLIALSKGEDVCHSNVSLLSEDKSRLACPSPIHFIHGPPSSSAQAHAPDFAVSFGSDIFISLHCCIAVLPCLPQDCRNRPEK